MDNIYLPIDNVNDFACYSIYDKDTVRAYYAKPALESSSNYVDFYVNSHYLQKTGIQSWGQWNTSLPTCLSSDTITTDYYYRNDFPDILLIFIIFAIIGIYLPFKLISRIFRKGVL